MTLPSDEQAFFCQAMAQLEPSLRPVFVERVAQTLGAHPSPGPGDVDRAIRGALAGLWVPPDTTEWRTARWDPETPDRASKRAG